MTETDGNTPDFPNGRVFYVAYKAAHPWGEELEAFESVSLESQRAMEAGAGAVAAPLREELARLRESFRALAIASSSAHRCLYATWIDLMRDQPGLAMTTLSEALDGFDDAPEWDGTESGVAWLERTREPRSGDVKAEAATEGGPR